MANRMQQLMDRYREITSQPIEYADNIPDLMKYENYDAEYLASHDDHFQKLDAMPHLDRAKLGAGEWNQWVQWAQLVDERWMEVLGVGGHWHISLLGVGKVSRKNDLNLQNEIDFSLGQALGRDGSYSIEEMNFRGHVFAGPVSFAWAQFENFVIFENVQFVDRASFLGARFADFVSFTKIRFGDDAEFRGARFEKEGMFAEVHFEGRAIFWETLFKEQAWFSSVRFMKEAKYTLSIFVRGGLWQGSIFQGNADWCWAYLLGLTDFSDSRFEATVYFEDVFFGKTERTPHPSVFRGGHVKGLDDAYDLAPCVDATSNIVPNFQGTVFKLPPNLGYAQVADPVAQQGRWWQWGKNLKAIFSKDGRTQDAYAAAKLRRLQELAAAGHHNLAEKRFFRAELLCRRGHEARSWQEIAMINLFELFSKCGLSFWRPIFWWAGFSCLFGLYYGFRATLFGMGGFLPNIKHLVNYTLANAFPIVGVFHASNSRAVDALFGEAGGVPFDVGLMAGAHNIASTIFLFFALLAVRNYFKLG